MSVENPELVLWIGLGLVVYLVVGAALHSASFESEREEVKLLKDVERLKGRFLQRKIYDRVIAKNHGACLHQFQVGGGLMGDAWKCSKCGLDKYPENIHYKDYYVAEGRVGVL